MPPYKRVLLISNNPITPYSAQGASRGSWFKDWDKDRLAHITFCDYKEENDFCNHYFTATREEKKFLRFFKKDNSNNKQTSNVKQISLSSYSTKKSFKSLLFLLINALTFPKYSKKLKKFIDEFKPDIIFASIADCYASRLAMMIAKKQSIPFITQQEDNWITSELDSSFIEKTIQSIRFSTIKKACKHASHNYTICPTMQRYFEKKIKAKFECLYCVDDFSRFIQPEKYDKDKKTTFLYIGNSQPDRSSGFVSIAKAINNLKLNNPEFIIYSNNLTTEHKSSLNEYDFVKIKPHIHHDEVARALSKANVLILCESFLPHNIDYTSLALSSKVQIYMMAKVPILVFASEKTGVCDYAKEYNFAQIQSENDIDMLTEKIDQITSDNKLRHQLISNSIDTAKKNHDASIIRNQLKETITMFCKN